MWYLAAELDGRLAGRVSLRMDGAGGAELGFGVHPDARGNGVARSASSLLCRHGFDHLGLTVVRWHSFVGNWPSRRVAWRLGFSFDGTERRRLARVGQPLADAWGGTLLPDELDRPGYLWLAVPDLGLPGEGPARRLRAPADRDVAAIVAAMADPAARSYLQVPADYGPAQAKAFLREIEEESALGTDLTWVAVDDRDAVLACVTLDLRSWEMGWWGHPAARRRGAVTSAVRRVARYAFDTLRANRLMARCAESNAASARVAELAGMRPAGRLRLGHSLGRRSAGARNEETRNQDTLLFDLVPGDLNRMPAG
jgi:RimJ/RimL family protein N-acetyltransferase